MNKKLTPSEALEKAKDIISDYSSAYMNENVPESEIYGTRKEKYKEYTEKDSMLYNQLDIIGTALKALEIMKEKKVNVQYFQSCLECNWDYELFEKWCQDNAPYEENTPYVHSMTKEEFDLLKEGLL